MNLNENMKKIKAISSFIALYAICSMSPQTLAQSEFDLGPGEEAFSWGQPIPYTKSMAKLEDEIRNMKTRIGFRLQTGMESGSKTIENQSQSFNDFYARRIRFQFEAKFLNNFKYYMDIRSDRVNQDDRGEGQFAIGDAYIQYSNFLGFSNTKLRLFRAKVDVSRSQTVSSSRLLFQDRASVSDLSADYISEGRRATNAQILGALWDKKINYQLVIGDGISGDVLEDAFGNSADSVESQNFMFGGKIKFSPFKGWEEKVSETFMGRGKHFTIGAGYFELNGINFKRANDTILQSDYNRSLTNVEFSFHYLGFNLAAEYFDYGGMIKDLTAVDLEIGRSEGGYIQGEYVFTNLFHLAPFFRTESWEKFNQDGFVQESQTLGLNYYLKGNKIKMGLFFEDIQREINLQSSSVASDESIVKLTTQFHY